MVTDHSDHAPTATTSISFVVPTHGVAAYLPTFLASVSGQRGGLDGVEFVFVDDGSPDDSARQIGDWIAAHPRIRARLVRQPNGGLSAARNAGLAVAAGEWVSFPDPDDVLHRRYVHELMSFVGSPAADRVHLIVGRVVYLNEGRRRNSDSHPLRFRFRKGDQIVDLSANPRYIHVAANTGLYRRAVIERFGLRFDPAVRPVWEDGHFTARYLSKFDRPRMALRSHAFYFYRRRVDGSSLMDGQWGTEGKFVAVPLGWLDALRTAAAEHGGRAPVWLQNMVLYDVIGYFKQERRIPSATAATPSATSDRFLGILEQVLQFIDAETIESFRVHEVPTEFVVALRTLGRAVEHHPRAVFCDAVDTARGLTRLHWYQSVSSVEEEYRVDGRPVAPVFAKTRACRFFGRTVMFERFVWVPLGRLSLSLDGEPVRIRTGPLHADPYELGADDIWGAVAGEPAKGRPRRPPAGARAARDRAVRRLKDVINKVRLPANRQRYRARCSAAVAWLPHHRMRYRDAWLLIDRDVQAQDNAEHLYRYLRSEQPTVKAWFVLSPASPDWPRLRDEGFRLIAHGSHRHRVALMHCAHLLSSQIDRYITEPLPAGSRGDGPTKTWRFTFLQHGVTKDDLSVWINPKPIDLMITATRDEQRSIVEDDSPYVWGDREVVLTGFPRHDRLLSLARGPVGRDPRLVLVMPTWRRGLVLDTVAGGKDLVLRTGFWDSEYARAWRSVLESPALLELLGRNGYELVFVPHPNMQRYLDDSPLPPSLRVHRFTDVDIQELLAQAAVLVTDYSSMGFEMAYLERAVVYFQFDREDFFHNHVYRQGTWSYDDDGFGPVTTSADAVVAAVGNVITRHGRPQRVHALRMLDAFPYRDGRCNLRTYEAVRAMGRRLPDERLYRYLESRVARDGRPVAEELADMSGDSTI